MLSRTFHFATLSALSAFKVSAHGHVSEVLINDESYYGHDPTKVPYVTQPDSITWTNGAKDNGFVTSTASALASPDIICHLNATNGLLTADVAAGTTITVDKTKLKFFKIDELGQLTRGTVPGQPGYWANNKLRDEDFSWNITIPAKLAPGSYVLRHEIIALHAGGAEGSTQMYPQCINLIVKGDGTAQPEGVFATDLYSSKDPGLLHNVFVDEWSDANDPGYLFKQAAATRIWARAAQIYLAIVTIGWKPDTSSVRESASEVLRLLQELEDPAILRSAVWPFCVAGMDERTKKQVANCLARHGVHGDEKNQDPDQDEPKPQSQPQSTTAADTANLVERLPIEPKSEAIPELKLTSGNLAILNQQLSRKASKKAKSICSDAASHGAASDLSREASFYIPPPPSVSDPADENAWVSKKYPCLGRVSKEGVSAAIAYAALREMGDCD
ncbi:endoglucanase IV precursor [Fusarium subglutinans]|uniref:lytic cellulose monooxygenase (C4-dehydrogenating) n=1 Tax=Gibberella subglutinans TaxID=42677 RepID=A0A8H5LAZ1_GIBSU|nr:endoglucanase IV precursor [Fusarium subglutinans]KAF5587311.1 endoglucanase IV precursor [Fusarium subglutinans]